MVRNKRKWSLKKARLFVGYINMITVITDQI